MARARSKASTPSHVRIIGGQWRGRKIAFGDAQGLRPTPDRVRETLFNWLAPDIHGARCLDLFAGSGALGLEALSRGAEHCTFVEATGSTLKDIQAALSLLDAATRADCHGIDALRFCQQGQSPYDIVFLDPPFGQNLVEACCAALDASALVTDNGAIYIETGADEPEPVVPKHWQLARDKRAAGVAYRLYRNG